MSGLKYLSVCSGIEAATSAWHHMGWEPVAFSEIEPFPSAVLAHHYPTVPNWGDMTKFQEWPDATVDVLVGGTPCQSFSVAGLRAGLHDPRGGLMLTFLEIARRYRPRWVVWENVPGVLSSNGGRDFGSFLGALGYLGYGWAYRVLDAQWFGVAQRRRRVFVVGCLGDRTRAGKVLFEQQSVRRNPAPSREARKDAAGSIGDCAANSSWPADIASTLNAAFGSKQGLEDQHALSGASLFVPAQPVAFQPGNLARGAGSEPSTKVFPTLKADQGRTFSDQSPHVAVAMRESGQGFWMQDAIAGTLRVEGENRPSRPSHVIAQPVATDLYNGSITGDVAATLGTPGSSVNASGPTVMQSMQVRRLTPVECERLQGFPDDYTLIPWKKKPADQCPDGPRYKALGNSMAVPVMRWIGEGIDQWR